MDVPVEVPGLDTILPVVSEGSIVVVESGADAVKSFFARRLAKSALSVGGSVTFVTSRDGAVLSHELLNGGELSPADPALLVVLERESLEPWNEIELLRGLVVVDSFSFLALGLSLVQLSEMLRRLRAVAHAHGLTAVLATDRGMFDVRSETILDHLSDGLIQFHAKEGADGLIRFLRVPKWTSGTLIDRNIYYEYDGKRLAIDLRRRVL